MKLCPSTSIPFFIKQFVLFISGKGVEPAEPLGISLKTLSPFTQSVRSTYDPNIMPIRDPIPSSSLDLSFEEYLHSRYRIMKFGCFIAISIPKEL
jgi:hypothetical protein